MLAETDEETKGLQLNSKLADIDIVMEKGEIAKKRCLQKAAELLNQKADVIGKRIPNLEASKTREINRRINDPYLLMLRKTMGLGETLNEADILALQKKKLNEEETEFSKLMVLVSTSFLESDGEFAIAYIEHALRIKDMPEIYKRYLQCSLDRLRKPEKYGESLGFMIIELEEGSLFDKAGFKVGDVLTGIDNNPLIEPSDISSALGRAKEYQFILNLQRNSSPMTIAIQPGKSAGVTLTQLICFHQFRL